MAVAAMCWLPWGIGLIMSGATAIEIGSANLIDPWTMPRIISELQPRMDELGIKSLEEIRGVV